MKIYFASFFEPENFGNGRKLAITTSKPDSFEVDGKLSYFTPSDELIQNYKNKQLNDQKEAADYFNKHFYDQLKLTYSDLNAYAKQINKTIMEVLPLKDGDTLLSWERHGFSNYRGTVAGLLKKIGYEIILK